MIYKIIVDKQSRTNPSSEKKEYTIDIEELRVKGNVYDSLVITKDEDYVMRRLSLSELQVLNVLEKPIKQPLPDLNIELFEGDNYIYLVDMIGNKFYAEYLVKNEFTEMYVTNAEMNSAINQSATQIELTVNQKLTGYSTTEEMNSAINIKANEIKSSVSETYTTKEETDTAKKEAIDSANNNTNEKLKDYSTTLQMNSAIDMKADSIISSVSKKIESIQPTINEQQVDDYNQINITEAINTTVVKLVFNMRTYDKSNLLDYIPLTFIVDKFDMNNISSDAKQFTIDPGMPLYDLNGVSDQIVIEGKDDYSSCTIKIIKNIKYSSGKLVELSEPLEIILSEQNITLFKGDNYIYTQNQLICSGIYIKYLKNTTTDKYYQSVINQTAESINSEVRKKVGNDEIISKINQSAEEVRNRSIKNCIDSSNCFKFNSRQ